MLKKYVTFSNIENAQGDMILGMYNHVKTDNCYEDIYILNYVGDNFIIYIMYIYSVIHEGIKLKLLEIGSGSLFYNIIKKYV